uniref:Uncharacterized protein LOC102803310 n=1 Tax=Saccoglossus kowalevskii TaxID=10224 RepID=A0ABM0MPN6_SACKO|nr:PREDICTED: uncharacterized protein LOC102803310 [Saccoglossus kowalevskii]
MKQIHMRILMIMILRFKLMVNHGSNGKSDYLKRLCGSLKKTFSKYLNGLQLNHSANVLSSTTSGSLHLKNSILIILIETEMLNFLNERSKRKRREMQKPEMQNTVEDEHTSQNMNGASWNLKSRGQKRPLDDNCQEIESKKRKNIMDDKPLFISLTQDKKR